MPGVLFGPAIVGILVDRADFSEQYAGWAMAYQSIGSATALLIISSFIHSLDLKRLAFITLIFAFILEIYCSFNSTACKYFLTHNLARESLCRERSPEIPKSSDASMWVKPSMDTNMKTW